MGCCNVVREMLARGLCQVSSISLWTDEWSVRQRAVDEEATAERAAPAGPRAGREGQAPRLHGEPQRPAGN